MHGAVDPGVKYDTSMSDEVPVVKAEATAGTKRAAAHMEVRMNGASFEARRTANISRV